MTDSNFALDGGESRAEDSAWRMFPNATLPRCTFVLERIDTVRNVARYYVLSIEPTLFAKHTLIRRWGRIGAAGGGTPSVLRGEDAARAQMALETWLARKRKRGYAPSSGPACPALPSNEGASG